MKAALASPLWLAAAGNAEPPRAAASPYVTVNIPSTAEVAQSRPDQLNLSVSERCGPTLRVNIAVSGLTGVSRADLFGPSHPVRFALRREAGTVMFNGQLPDGIGAGMLQYAGDPANWSKLATMGVVNDMADRPNQLLASPLLDGISPDAVKRPVAHAG